MNKRFFNSDTQNPLVLVAILWITYAAFYLGRVNISPVLQNIALDLEISAAQVGSLGTIFFWSYAVGMFVIGEMGAYISPHLIVTIGLILTIVCNLVFAMQSSFVGMAILWAINGFAQASGWSPMMRILAEKLDAEKAKQASTIMPFSYVIGTALTWTLIGILTTSGQWRVAFYIPAILLSVFLAIWLIFRVDAPTPISQQDFSWQRLLVESKELSLVLIASALVGFIYVGSIIWLPAYVDSTGLVPPSLAGFTAAMMQVIAIGGLFAARRMIQHNGKVVATTSLLLLLTSIVLLITTISNPVVTLFSVTLALLIVNGAVGLLVGSVPIVLSKTGRTSSVTGTVNAVSSLGGGIAGFGIGYVIDRTTWQVVFVIWAFCALFAAALLWMSRQQETAQQA